MEDAASRVNELSTININLAAQRTKLEQELSIISADYDEVSKELKVHEISLLYECIEIFIIWYFLFSYLTNDTKRFK